MTTQQKDILAKHIFETFRWCRAVQKENDWDGWDHHYQRVCYSILPDLGISQAAEGEYYGKIDWEKWEVEEEEVKQTIELLLK